MKIHIAILFCCFFFISTIAYAHPPQDIIITFDKQMRILQAIIVHNVSNPENHFIKKVDVGLNGKEILTHVISRQDNNETQKRAGKECANPSHRRCCPTPGGNPG